VSTPQQNSVPDWFQKHAAPACNYISRLKPNPFDQPADTQDFISLHQNDYLRLGNHDEVVSARAAANESSRNEAFLSSVYGGASEQCDLFQKELADCLRCDDVMLTTSGWAGNLGLIEAITPVFTPVYLDAHAHASLFDGVKLSTGKKVVVKHNDTDDLVQRIEKNGPGIVCIDAVYSTDGSIGDIEKYVDICEKYDCVLVLDEAHSFGLFGNGAGLAVELGLEERVPFRTISLNKALGGHGGLIAGSGTYMQLVRVGCRSVIFSSATSSVSAAGHRAALRVIREQPDRARRCLSNAEYFRRQMQSRGIDVGDSQCQIVSIRFGDEQESCDFYSRMRDHGVLTSVFLYPAIPLGQGLVRFSVHSEATREDLDYVVEQAANVSSDSETMVRFAN